MEIQWSSFEREMRSGFWGELEWVQGRGGEVGGFFGCWGFFVRVLYKVLFQIDSFRDEYFFNFEIEKRN